MLLKIIAVLFIISIVKAASTGGQIKWISEVIEKFNPKIIELKESIEILSNKTVDNELMLSSSTLRLILVRNESETLLSTLKSIVNTTLEEATDGEVDIKSCVDAELKSQDDMEEDININVEEIEIKYLPDYEKFLDTMLSIKNMLPSLNEKVDGLLQNCLLNHFLPWHENELIECITKGIEEYKSEISKLESIVSSIKDKSEELFDKMEDDIIEMTRNLLLEIFGIVETLKECIVLIKPDTPFIP